MRMSNFLSVRSNRIVRVTIIVGAPPHSGEPEQAKGAKKVPNKIGLGSVLAFLRFGGLTGLVVCRDLGWRRCAGECCSKESCRPSIAHASSYSESVA